VAPPATPLRLSLEETLCGINREVLLPFQQDRQALPNNDDNEKPTKDILGREKTS